MNCSTIVDLRQMSVRQMEPLLEEEARHWRGELHWDYRNSVDLIKRFLDAHSLAGYAAVDNGQAAGYSFYVLEEQKGLIGGLYVSPKHPQEEIGRRLLDELLFTLRAVPHLERIEAQLMPFGCAMDQVLSEHKFHLFARQFMLLAMSNALALPGPDPHLRLERWNDSCFEPCARLIHLAYADHVDSAINDQYQSAAGALRFLKNIIYLPGCGEFQPAASFVLRSPGSSELVGAVLSSEVAPRVGHITQICVQPGFQGQGLGRKLILAAVAALRGLKFAELTLTVTSSNTPAVHLYDTLGFRTIKTFSAGVWPA
jgi:ribosomal protein S18 acetylase RimI-like enzyme